MCGQTWEEWEECGIWSVATGVWHLECGIWSVASVGV